MATVQHFSDDCNFQADRTHYSNKFQPIHLKFQLYIQNYIVQGSKQDFFIILHSSFFINNFLTTFYGILYFFTLEALELQSCLSGRPPSKNKGVIVKMLRNRHFVIYRFKKIIFCSPYTESQPCRYRFAFAKMFFPNLNGKIKSVRKIKTNLKFYRTSAGK